MSKEIFINKHYPKDSILVPLEDEEVEVKFKYFPGRFASQDDYGECSSVEILEVLNYMKQDIIDFLSEKELEDIKEYIFRNIDDIL